MSFVRSIGRWTLTALMINCIIGSGIFEVPGQVTAEVGRAGPIAMIVAGLSMGIIVACFTEVGSQFSEPGGVYLYARTAFGGFVGLQVGWFWFLSTLASAAAAANLLVDYFAAFVPAAAHGWPRPIAITTMILVPALANYRGIRQGALLSNIFTVAKLLPLAILIVLGLIRFSRHAEFVTPAEIIAPGWRAWANALVLLYFIYSGYEDSMIPAGEVKDPRRTIPVSLVMAMAACMAVYTLVQFLVVATTGTSATQRPVAAAAAILMGHGGQVFVEVAAMISAYGWLSASMLNAPRLLFSMADRQESVAPFGKLHPRFNTPHISVVTFALLAWLLALTGTFRWAVVLSAGAAMIFDGVVCAALLRLRRIQPEAALFRLPFGRVLSVLGMLICVVLLSRMEFKQVLLMGITALIATANWWWARRRSALTKPGACAWSERSSPLRDGIAPGP
jgi:amino acid transporter